MRVALIIASLLAFSGCARQYPTKEAVYIPTKCDIQMPQPPYPKDNQPMSERIGEILQYTELLEADLRFCTGGAK